MNIRTILPFCAALCIAATAPVVAQWTAAVSGSVVDMRTMQPVSGAKVSIYTMGGTHELGRAVTDDRGDFSISGLRGGDYWLLFQKDGYQRSAIGGIDLRPHERLIEIAPMGMYPNGMKMPRTIGAGPCGSLVQPAVTSDVYVVCSGD
jgi:hypothetical protein